MAKERKRRASLPKGWIVQKLTSRMRTPCSTCGEAIVGVYRVKHMAATRPFPTQSFHCPHCAVRGIHAEIAIQLEKVNYFVYRVASDAS